MFIHTVACSANPRIAQLRRRDSRTGADWPGWHMCAVLTVNTTTTSQVVYHDLAGRLQMTPNSKSDRPRITKNTNHESPEIKTFKDPQCIPIQIRIPKRSHTDVHIQLHHPGQTATCLPTHAHGRSSASGGEGGIAEAMPVAICDIGASKHAHPRQNGSRPHAYKHMNT